MPLILYIETSTKTCSVVLAKDNQLLAEVSSHSSYTHAESITLFIEDVMQKSKCQLSDLDAVAVSKGPGSYMGLRIGVSTAKGLCYALGIPLIAADTLQVMATYMSAVQNDKDALFCPMIDARRMEVYCAIYNYKGETILPIGARIIDETSFNDLSPSQKIYFFGDGAPKCRELLSQREGSLFDEEYLMTAKSLIQASLIKYNNKDFEDIAYFEPYYLKDFIPGKSNVKGLK